ncbi:hypothetical protein TNCV_3451981 [Trichonephila clavipes]|nr:hypothetical protein TNCV_3451981 [Trichonephila clavipes]
MAPVILNYGQVTWTTTELAPPLLTTTPRQREDLSALDKGCGSPVVKVSNHGRHVMSSIPVPLKTRRVGQRCTLNLSTETSSRWCGVVDTTPTTMVQNCGSVAKSPRVAEQCDVNISFSSRQI